jgi:hypothetical protein
MTIALWIALALAAVLGLLLAWLVRSRVAEEAEAPVVLGRTLPRCRTCAWWPGPDAPCPLIGEPQEPEEWCHQHTQSAERAN